MPRVFCSIRIGSELSSSDLRLTICRLFMLVLQAGYTRLLLGGGEWFKMKGCGAGCGGATQVQW